MLLACILVESYLLLDHHRHQPFHRKTSAKLDDNVWLSVVYHVICKHLGLLLAKSAIHLFFSFSLQPHELQGTGIAKQRAIPTM